MTRLVDLLGKPLPALLRAVAGELEPVDVDVETRLDHPAKVSWYVKELHEDRSLARLAVAVLRTRESRLTGPRTRDAEALLKGVDPQLVASLHAEVHALATDREAKRVLPRDSVSAPMADALTPVLPKADASRLKHLEKQLAQARTQRDTYRGRTENLQQKVAFLEASLATAVADVETSSSAEKDLRTQRDSLRKRSENLEWLANQLLTVAPVPETAEESTALEVLRAWSRPPVATHDLQLRVDVLGGGEEIGGSCVLVEAAGTRVLIDCGARPNGYSAEDVRPRRYLEALDGNIDAVIITHAHNDHAGWVPALIAERSNVALYATSATCDLLAPMWRDGARVTERTGINAFTQRHVDDAIAAFNECDYHREYAVGNLTFELGQAGHIIGAAAVTVRAGDKRVVVTGDVSMPGQESVGGYIASPMSQAADLMLLETTYASEDALPNRGDVVRDFLRAVDETYNKGGLCLVPAFALGRTQEIALILGKYRPDMPVLIDGLARDLTDVYETHLSGGRKVFSKNIVKVPAGGTQAAINRFGQGVVITTSGMMNGGPVIHWAKKVLPDSNSRLMMVGYQSPTSPGGKLLKLATSGGGAFDLATRDRQAPEKVEVYAEVGKFALGAHASAPQLRSIVEKSRPHNVMLVHGEERNQQKFKASLTAQKRKVVPSKEPWTPA